MSHAIHVHPSAAPAGTPARVLTPDVVVIGAGPSGLRLAADLAMREPNAEVLVLEREAQAGGIPRHSDHPGYGIRDLRTFVSGPRYAKILVDAAEWAGATILTEAMATRWAGPHSLEVTHPSGRLRVEAKAVVLATGARERPRPARMIPGDRPDGVFTTGYLQNLVHVKHQRVGERAVIVGAELVSWSAALTLREAGCRTVLMTTEHPRADAYAAFSGPGRILFSTKVSTRTRVVRIIGRPRVTGVEIENIDTGARRIIDADTVIFTGSWVPDNELARTGGVELDVVTRGPVVDSAFRTNLPGVFAVGNVLHPVDTADIAALDGAAAVAPIIGFLHGAEPAGTTTPLEVEAPLKWISPGVIRPGDQEPARGRLELWSQEFVAFPRIVVRQGGEVIHRTRLPWPAAPGRVFRIPSTVLRSMRHSGEPVTISLDR